MTAPRTCHPMGANHTRWRTQLTRLAPSKTLRLRSKCGRIKIIHPITFWQRFFFLWLRFFLFGRSKKKEMNKTASYTTEYFAYAQYDTPSSCKLFGVEAAPKRNKQPPSA